MSEYSSRVKTLAFRDALAFGLLLVLALPSVLEAQFDYTTNNGAITITKYTGPGGAVIIPGSTNGYPVTSIGDQAFFDNRSITSVLILMALARLDKQPSAVALF